MKIPVKTILGLLLPMAVLLVSNQGLAQEQSQTDQILGSEKELSLPVPNLADIVPLAVELTGRLASLEKKVKDVPDISEVEKQFAGIEANLKRPADQLQRVKESKEYRYHKLVELKETIEREYNVFAKTSRPLSQALRQLETYRKEWLAEKNRWNEWLSSRVKEDEQEQLQSTFSKVNDTIQTALDLILSQLEALLMVQEKAGNINAKIKALTAELEGMIVEERRGALLIASPPMLSFKYISQFRSELWYAVQKGLAEISWPDTRFFARHGGIVLIQVFLSLAVMIAVYRNRRVLNESERWRFLAARLVSAGLFFGTIATVWFYEYWGVPAIWELAYTTVAGISFARLSGRLVEASWKRQFVYGLMAVLIITALLTALNFPLPLFRLHTALTGLVALFFCLRWAGERARQKDSGLYTGLLRLGALFFTVIVIAEFWGKAALSGYLFASLVDSIATVLVFMLLMHLIRGGLEWLFRTSPLRLAAVLHGDTDAVIRRVAHFIDAGIWGLVLVPSILMIWGIYNSLQAATKGVLALGFNLGAQRINVGLVLASAAFVYGSFLVSWILQKLLMDEVLVSRRVERGVRLSIGRLVHYVLIFMGFSLGLIVLGFDFTKLTIMLSALGVGIGFGLQSVVNNFVSGLILLFERPVRVGDMIELGGTWAEVRRIGLRSTTVQTFDQADLIIPNADLVSNPVTNWTLSNRQVRLIIQVGVAYGSDVPLVMETLMACPQANVMVVKTPAPQVLFLSFGESSLDFELRVWVSDANDRLKVRSELHQEIDRRFREAKIEIAFPQRDLHLRSLDESVILRPPETAK